MRVFVTGASGFIGSAVVRELIGSGHDVIGLARSEASAQAVKAAGARVHRGSIEDLESLRKGASLADGAIHTAFFHEFTHASLGTRLRAMFGGAPTGIVMRFLAAALETDRRAVDTIGRALQGSDPAIVMAGATMALRPGHLGSEDHAADPNAPGGPRGGSERVTAELASAGVRASVVRLPPLVHGEDDRHGFGPRLIDIARKKQESVMIGDGANRWAAVHRPDAARLLRLALESGTAGAKYHAIGDEGVPFKEIAEIIARRSNVPVATRPASDADKHFSWLGRFISADNPVSSALTQGRLGWAPTGPGIIEDLNGPWYFR